MICYSKKTRYLALWSLVVMVGWSCGTKKAPAAKMENKSEHAAFAASKKDSSGKNRSSQNLSRHTAESDQYYYPEYHTEAK